MNGRGSSLRAKVLLSAFAACLLSFQGLVFKSQAQVVLTDQNSEVRIQLNGAPGLPAGMNYWAVDGRNQLNRQWFWYRVGDTAERSIDTVSPASFTLTGTRGVTTIYANNLFSVRIDYWLSGGAPLTSGVSDIAESITINNLSGAPLDFHFFQYSDFDLNSPAPDDTVQLGRNLRGLFNEAAQTDAGFGLTETVTTPGANHGEAALFPTTLNKLDDADADNLNDNISAGPGDATWAFQWDLTIAAGSSAIISKDKYLSIGAIPEPSSFALICLGVASLALYNRRRSV
jgi:hypothetical protein